MGYQILQRPLDDTIIEKVPLQSEVLLAHSTANPGAGDEDHFNWLNQATRHGWANYYLDHDSISQLISEGFQAPSAGPTGNGCALSFEMCEPAANLPWAEQVRRFNETWARAVWLASDILHRYQWGIDRLLSHADWSKRYPAETNHTDPLAFFERYGKTWDQFVADVDNARIGKGAFPPGADWQEGYITRLISEGLLSQRRPANQPVLWWEQAAQNLKLLDRIRALEEQLKNTGAPAK